MEDVWKLQSMQSEGSENILVHLRAVGSVARLHNPHCYFKRSLCVTNLIRELRIKLEIYPQTALFVYVTAGCFSPHPDMTLGELFSLFHSKSRRELSLSYGLEEVWG